MMNKAQYNFSDGRLICGVDEAGRGPLAGPVVAAAVILGDNIIDELRDSKALSDKQRRRLRPLIEEQSIAFAVGVADVAEIDKYNIRQATMFAMQRAVSGIVICPDVVLVDGDFTPDFQFPAESLIGGDRLCAEIMAASILAKTARDDMMLALHELHPHYGFANHKGYGTAEHIQALQTHGAIDAHRKTFAPVKAVL